MTNSTLVDKIMDKLYKVEGKWPDSVGVCGECHLKGMEDAIRGLRIMGLLKEESR